MNASKFGVDTAPVTDPPARDTQPLKEPHHLRLGERAPYVLPLPYDDIADRQFVFPVLAEMWGDLVQIEFVQTDGAGETTLGLVGGNPSPYPDPLKITMSANVGRSDTAQGATVAHKHGRELVRWLKDQPILDGERIPAIRQVAVIGRLAPYETRLRGEISRVLGCEPWAVLLSTSWTVEGGVGVLQTVHVHDYPVIADPLVRRKRWQTLIDDIRKVSPGASWRIEDDGAAGAIRLTRADDPLAGGFNLSEFEARYRADFADPYTSWAGFPVAIRENHEAVLYTTFHTLIVGQTGAGKGSVLWSIMSGLLPAAREGLVEFYAIDPKNSEAKAGAGIFEQIAVTPDEWAVLLDDQVADLKARQARSGRSFKISKETPLRILFIDEMSALSVLDTDPKRRADVDAALMILLSQGRSDGFIVVGAVQAPQKDMVGRSRMFFAMRVALRTETAMETDLVLGNGSVDQGALAHLIEPANPGNCYRTAGTGYMRLEGESDPVRVRFPYTDDETLAAWSTEFAEMRASRVAAPQVIQVATMAFALDDLDAGLVETDTAPHVPTTRHSPASPGDGTPPVVHDDGWGD